jgi:hypothetical protein
MEDDRNVFEIVIGKSTEKILLERPRSKWEHNIRKDFKGNTCGYEELD